jgi:hypothetical protein
MREGYSLDSLADLRAIPPEQRTAKSARRIASKNAWYGFNPLSTAGDDNDLVIAPNDGTGRWEMMTSATAGDGGSGGGGGDGLEERVTALENTVSGLVSGGSGGLTASILGAAFAKLFIYQGDLIDGSYNSATDESTLVFNQISFAPIDTSFVVLEVRNAYGSMPFTVSYTSSEGYTSAIVKVSGDYSFGGLVASILRFPEDFKIQQWIEDEASGS